MKKFVALLVVGALISVKLLAQTTITVDDAAKHIGESVNVCGKVVGAKVAENKQTTLNIGSNLTGAKINVAINPNDRKNFPYRPEVYLLNKDVCVKGILTGASGRFEISALKDDQIELQEGGGGDASLPFNPLSKYFDWEK